MRLRELQDIYLGQDIYIIGAGPSVNLFPLDFLKDKICLSLNDTYKMHPAVKPIVIMNNPAYAHAGSRQAPFHPNFKDIKYAVAKLTGRYRSSKGLDWDDPYFYCYDWSHKIDTDLWTMTKDTDYLYSSPEGCILHEAMQLCWILGAKNVFIIGCDSRKMGGRHYADFNKDGFSADEDPKGFYKKERNYDSYVYGTLIVQEFLKRKGVNVFNLSTIIGYHLVDYQFEVLKGATPFQNVLEAVGNLPKWDGTPELTDRFNGAPGQSGQKSGGQACLSAGKDRQALETLPARERKLRARRWSRRIEKLFSGFDGFASFLSIHKLTYWISFLRYRRSQKSSRGTNPPGYHEVFVLKRKSPDRRTEEACCLKGAAGLGRYCLHYAAVSDSLPRAAVYHFVDGKLFPRFLGKNPHLWGSQIRVYFPPSEERELRKDRRLADALSYCQKAASDCQVVLSGVSV